MNEFDVVIIGSGLGGLIAGAKLSKEGKKVLIIEQHSIPGGCATSFKRKDFIIEAGLHAIDGFDANDPKRVLLDELKIEENVEFLRVPEFYRFTNNRIDVVIPDNTEEAISVLVQKFPEEKKGIIRFFKRMISIQKQTGKFLFDKRNRFIYYASFPFVYSKLVFNVNKTLGYILEKNIKNDDLKLILQANLLYYHDDPLTMTMLYFSAGQASYYNGGGYYIKGGSQKLSDYLTSYIQERGGVFQFNCTAKKILTKDKVTNGVEYFNAKTQEIKTVFSNTVIANMAIPHVANIISQDCTSIISNPIKKFENACSLLSIYLCFKSDIKKLGSRNYSTIIFDESVKTLNDVGKNSLSDYEKRNFVFVDYSQIDSGLAPLGKSSGVICMIDYLDKWNKLSLEDYKKKKEEVAQIFIKRLEKIIPGITQEIELYEVATPKTIHRFTSNPGGSAYGFAQIPKQTGMFRCRQKSTVGNLYYASAWANPGGGFTGAMLSGWLCANEIMLKK